MLTERSKVPSEPKKRDFFPAKNPVDARREVVWEEKLVAPLVAVPDVDNTLEDKAKKLDYRPCV